MNWISFIIYNILVYIFNIFYLINPWNSLGKSLSHKQHISMAIFSGKRYKGSNTGKRARRKNLRYPRERFLVSNEALPSWRPIEIFPAGVWNFSVLPSYRCLILFSTNISLKVQYFPSWDTPYMKYDVTHILTSFSEEWRQRYGKGHLEIRKNENKTQIYLIRLDSVLKKKTMVKSVIYLLFSYQTGIYMWHSRLRMTFCET